MSVENEFQKQWEQLKKEIGNPLKFLVPIASIFLFVIFYQSFYTVEPDEQAVIIRLGRYHSTNPPGLHFKWPLVDSKILIQTTKIHQEEFGFRTDSYGERGTKYSTKNFNYESLMLTGDLNVADVEWVVQYKIADPFKFIFRSSSPIQTLRDVSESIMRRVVGDQPVNDVLTTGRVKVASEAKDLMQSTLDVYDLGIQIVSVKLQDVNPPEMVKESFNEVNKAKQEQEKMINQAEKSYNEIIPEAKGKAEELISQAEGYATALVNRSEGDAKKFEEVYFSYAKAPQITKKRIYIETMEDLFKKFKKITIVDERVRGLLPVFNGKKGE